MVEIIFHLQSHQFLKRIQKITYLLKGIQFLILCYLRIGIVSFRKKEKTWSIKIQIH